MFNLLGGWCDFSQLIKKESKRNLVSFSETAKKAARCSSSAARVTGPRLIQRRRLARRQLLGKFSAIILPAHCLSRGSTVGLVPWMGAVGIFQVKFEASCISAAYGEWRLLPQWFRIGVTIYLYSFLGTVLFMKDFLIQLRGRAWSARHSPVRGY